MFGKPHHHRIDLAQQGKHAPATVVAISGRGRAVTHGADTIMSNTEIDLKTRLRVEPGDEPWFEVEQHLRYPQTFVPAVGSRLSVRYDPDDHDHIMIDRSAAGMSVGGTTAADLLATIESQRAGAADPMALANALISRMGVAPHATPTIFVHGQQVGGPNPGSPAASAVDPVTILERLAQLRANGVLTEAEFQAQKARVLRDGA